MRHPLSAKSSGEKILVVVYENSNTIISELVDEPIDFVEVVQVVLAR